MVMSGYSHKGHYYVDKPRQEVSRIINLLEKGASVLDIGAGYGNNTKLLLRNGYDVTALETNPAAVKALRQISSDNLTVLNKSTDSVIFHQEFDAVINCMVLHFLESEHVALKVIANMQSWTKPGGYNVITSYLDDNVLGAEYSFLLKSGQLQKLYADWQILLYKESYARTIQNMRNPKDIARLLLGRKGYKAARLIARRLER